MNKTPRPTLTQIDRPWSVVVPIAQIPEAGLKRRIEANEQERAAMATLAGLPGMPQASATFDVMRQSMDRLHVTGRVQARVIQTCVVTLEPIENEIDEPIDITFAPASQIVPPPKTALTEEGSDLQAPDPPEPIAGDAIDLGAVAMDLLFLGIDPYPRKPGVMFEAPPVEEDPEDHPFAGLKILKESDGGPQVKKPKSH